MYESRAYDNEHGDPVVVLVVTGTHDVSRIVQALHTGNCEQYKLGEQVVRQVRRHNGGHAALRLLRAHGGPDLTAPEPGTDVIASAYYAGFMAARDHYGVADPDRGDAAGHHGAECQRTENADYVCTCREDVERIAALRAADEYVRALTDHAYPRTDVAV